MTPGPTTLADLQARQANRQLHPPPSSPLRRSARHRARPADPHAPPPARTDKSPTKPTPSPTSAAAKYYAIGFTQNPDWAPFVPAVVKANTGPGGCQAITQGYRAAFKSFKGPYASFLADHYAHAYGYLSNPAVPHGHPDRHFYQSNYDEFGGWAGFQTRIQTGSLSLAPRPARSDGPAPLNPSSTSRKPPTRPRAPHTPATSHPNPPPQPSDEGSPGNTNLTPCAPVDAGGRRLDTALPVGLARFLKAPVRPTLIPSHVLPKLYLERLRVAIQALPPDTAVTHLITSPGMPPGIYRFANPPALYQTLLDSVAPRVPHEDPLPSIYLPCCVFCHQELAITSDARLPTISVLMHGLEEGMAYHDICAAACAADVLLLPGAYGTRKTECASLSVLAATRVYQAPLHTTPAARASMVEIADTYLAEHAAREKEFAVALQHHIAGSSSKAAPSPEQAAAGIPAFAQLLPAASAPDPPPAPTRDFPPPVSLLTISDELESVMAPIQTRYPRWNRTPPVQTNFHVGYPTIVRFTHPYGEDPSVLVPPLSSEASIPRVLDEAVHCFGQPLSIWPLRTCSRQPQRPDAPQATPPAHEQSPQACGLLVQWASERLQMLAIAVSALPTLHIPGSNLLARHHIPPRDLLYLDPLAPLPDYHPGLLVETVYNTGGRHPPAVVTNMASAPIPLYTFLTDAPSAQNHRAWRDWFPHQQRSTGSTSRHDEERPSKRSARWYPQAYLVHILMLALMFLPAALPSTTLPAALIAPTPSASSRMNTYPDGCFLACRTNLAGRSTLPRTTRPCTASPTGDAREPPFSLRTSSRNGHDCPHRLNLLYMAVRSRRGPWGADVLPPSPGGLLINLSMHITLATLAAIGRLALLESLLLANQTLRHAVLPCLTFIIARAAPAGLVAFFLTSALSSPTASAYRPLALAYLRPPTRTELLLTLAAATLLSLPPPSFFFFGLAARVLTHGLPPLLAHNPPTAKRPRPSPPPGASSAPHPPSPHHSHNPPPPSQTQTDHSPPSLPALPKPSVPPGHANLRIGNWNVAGLRPSKWHPCAKALHDQAVDVCIITETHWNIDSDRSFVNESLWTESHVNYHDPAEDPPLAQSRRGGVALLLPPASQISAALVRKWHDTRVTAATWKLQHHDWTQPVYLSAVYKSPGGGDNDENTAADVQTISAVLTHPTPDGPHIVTGDFNAHTADESEGPHALHLPPRRSDNHQPNQFGLALLGMLQPISWIIATNRLVSGTTSFSRAVVVQDPHDQTRLLDQRSCLDYFLMHVDHWHSIMSEAIIALSGASLGKSDHNLCLMDWAMPVAPPTAHQPPPIHFLPLPQRPTFDLHALATNQHTHNSRQGRSGPLPPPQALYARALEATLPAWLHTARLHLQAGHAQPSPQILAFQPTLDTLYTDFTALMAQGLHDAVGPLPATGQSIPNSTRAAPPHSPSLSALCQAQAHALDSLADAMRQEQAFPNDPAYAAARRQMEQHFAILSKRVAVHQHRTAQNTFQHRVNVHPLRSDQPSRAWKTLKALVHPPERGVPNLVKDTAGKLILSQTHSAHRWHEARAHTSRDRSLEPVFDTAHLRQLAAEDHRLASLQVVPHCAHPRFSAPPSLDEVRAALHTCANGKAPGIDAIPFEAYTYGGPLALQALHTLLCIIWSRGIHPLAWNKAYIVPLFKGGPDLTNIDKYRAITLLQSASKIYEAFLLARLEAHMQENHTLSSSQGGFRAFAGPQETAYGLLALLYERKRAGLTSCVAFVDFETAFPTIFKPVVWTTLHTLGVHGKLWHNTLFLFQNVQSHVLHPLIDPNDFFDIPQGLREGSKLSPMLFNIAVNDMQASFRDRPAGPLGVSLQLPFCTTYAGVWQYADDVALVANSPAELQTMLLHLQSYCSHHGLLINTTKTKAVCFPAHQPPPASPALYLLDPNQQSKPIDNLQSFTYLGVPMDAALSMHTAFASTRGGLWAAHHYAARLGMRLWGLDVPSRILLWKTYVASQLAHRLPFLTPSQVARLQVDVNRSLARAFSPQASPTALAHELGIPPLQLQHARAIALLYGRLQSAHPDFLFSAVHTLLMAAAPTHQHPLSKAQARALRELDLSAHFPYIAIPALPPLRQPADLKAQAAPAHGASPLFPYRHAWEQLVDKNLHQQATATFTTWLAQGSHRCVEYRHLLPPPPARTQAPHPSWGHWPPNPRDKQRLLFIRTLATPLARNQHYQSTDPSRPTYSEAFCPLCLNPASQIAAVQTPDSLFHALLVCPYLAPFRLPLQEAAERHLHAHPLRHAGSARQTQPLAWAQLSARQQFTLLTATPLSNRTFTAANASLAEWSALFLSKTIGLTHRLLGRKRASHLR
jgi:hypothetical protein